MFWTQAEVRAVSKTRQIGTEPQILAYLRDLEGEATWKVEEVDSCVGLPAEEEKWVGEREE